MTYQAVATLKNNYWNEKFFYNLDEKILYIDDLKRSKCNVYQAVNTFNEPRRSEATICELKALYCDIDCHNGRFDEWLTLEVLRADFFAQEVPHPSKIINSGRGLQLYWYLENEKADSIPKWKVTQQIILNSLSSISEQTNCTVDFKCIDLSRVLRVPGTYNTKSNSYCRLVEEKGIKYTLDEILELFYDVNMGDLKPFNAKSTNNTDKATKTLTEAKNSLNKRSEWKEFRVKRINGIISMFNAYSLLTCRATDFRKLLELRNGDMLGMRDKFLMMYGWTIISKNDDLERLERELHGINSLFKEPLKDKEVNYKAQYIYNRFNKQVIKDADKSQFNDLDRYWFRNTTIIKDLEINLEEQKHMTTIISKEEKNRRKCEREKKSRRNDNGLTKKQQEKADLQNDIIEYRFKGMTNKEIADALNIPLKSLERHITTLKKEGRL